MCKPKPAIRQVFDLTSVILTEILKFDEPKLGSWPVFWSVLAGAEKMQEK
jgi:hypothetical protein